MSVMWEWKNKMGSIEWIGTDHEIINVNVYKGNCLAVLINKFEEKEEKYQFFGFFHDIDHLKRCIGLAKTYNGEKNNIYKDEWVKWNLNIFFIDSIKIAKHLVKAGFKVELYYEEIK